KGRPGGRSATVDIRTGVASPTRGYDDFVMTDALQYFQVIKRAYHNAGQAIPVEARALYGDTTNPTLPHFTYIASGVTILSTDAFGRPVAVDTSMYNYPITEERRGGEGGSSR